MVLLVAFLLWKSSGSLLAPQNLVFGRRLLGQIQLCVPLDPVSELSMSSAMQAFLSCLGVNYEQQQYFGSLLENPDQQFKRGLLIYVGVFIRRSMALGGSIVSPNGKICMFIWQLTCIFDIFRKLINSMITYGFQTFLIVILPCSPFCFNLLIFSLIRASPFFSFFPADHLQPVIPFSFAPLHLLSYATLLSSCILSWIHIMYWHMKIWS